VTYLIDHEDSAIVGRRPQNHPRFRPSLLHGDRARTLTEVRYQKDPGRIRRQPPRPRYFFFPRLVCPGAFSDAYSSRTRSTTTA